MSLGREEALILAGPVHQKLQSLVIFQNVQTVFFGSKSCDYVGVSGSDQHPAIWPQAVEGLDMLGIPDVVQDDQAGLIGEKIAQPGSSLLHVVEDNFSIAKRFGEVRLALGELRLLAEGDPDHAVRKSLADLIVPRHSCCQDRLSDPAHALDADLSGGSGDPGRLLVLG